MDNTEGQSQSFYGPEDGAEGNQPGQDYGPEQDQESVSWTASEFIVHQKDAMWYATSVVATIIIAGLTFMITRGDLISVVTVLIVGILFVVLAHKKPRELPYMLDSRGITVGNKLYPYAVFKSFAVHQNGAIACINLMPLKRFMPELSVYYPPEQEESILGLLADYLPHDQRREAGIDRLSKKLRF